MHPLMELNRLALNAITRGILCQITLQQPLPAGFHIHVHDKGQIRNTGPHRIGIEETDGLKVKSAPIPLIGGGRINKPVTQDPGAPLKGRQNNGPHQLGSTGLKQQELRLRTDIFP